MSEDQESPSVIVKTSNGGIYDINNISGRRKLELIKDGEMGIDEFIAPDNMPGKKLKELRDAHRSNLGNALKQGEANTFKTGDLVQFKGVATEVTKVDPDKGLLITKKDGTKAWVHHSKVKPVTNLQD